MLSVLTIAGCAAVAIALWRLLSRDRKFNGVAVGSQVRAAAGRRALVRRRRSLRPDHAGSAPASVGFRLGKGAGVECWASIEDSFVVLGPPRSGKGLHLVVSAILDAPGAVVTTSTRPDNLAITLAAREAIGPAFVFDPQGLAQGVGSPARWSPTRGCESARVAIARARALCAEQGSGVENASFWAQQCQLAVRCLLHAAALDGRDAVELYRWSLSPLAAEEAADVLRSHPGAAPAWSTALETILAAEPRQRDSTWAMVSNAFAALADPYVLDCLTPTDGVSFDPEEFLRARGSLFLLGTASGASATSTLIAAFVEDLVETARRMAAVSTGARMDPPLAVILDEAANYPLPSLPSLMSDGGGTGITTFVVLQSLAQARSRWGQHEAAAIWDAASVKFVLGGSSNADDLRDLSALIGTRTERRVNESWGPDGRRTSSTSTHELPILDPGRLRTLPAGRAVLLLRSAPPIMLRMRPWTRRPDAPQLTASRARTEASLRLRATTAA